MSDACTECGQPIATGGSTIFAMGRGWRHKNCPRSRCYVCLDAKATTVAHRWPSCEECAASWRESRDDALVRALVLDDGHCPIAVTRAGELEPCDASTVALSSVPFDGRIVVSAVCSHHLHQGGWRSHVELLDVIMASRSEAFSSDSRLVGHRARTQSDR